MVPSATLSSVHPLWVHFAEKPLNTPAVGCVTTMSPTITPDPTGTSVVLAMAFAAGAAVPPGAAVVGLDSLAASGLLPYVLQAATTAVTRPRPAPSRTFCRETGNSPMFITTLQLELDAVGVEKPQRRREPHIHQTEEHQPTGHRNHPSPKAFAGEQQHLRYECAVEEAPEQ